LLKALADEHSWKHGGLEQSLATLSLGRSTRESLARLRTASRTRSWTASVVKSNHCWRPPERPGRRRDSGRKDTRTAKSPAEGEPA
jgi:hypothetical protein